MASVRPERSYRDSLLARIAGLLAKRQLKRFMRATGTAVEVQEHILRLKLRRNSDSAFGREHGFAEIRTYEDFTSRVPIRTYNQLKPYLDRVLAGETSALLGSGQRVLMFAVTSGSTDQPKCVPVTPAVLREYQRGWSVFGVKALLDHPEGFVRGILQVVSPINESRTEQGIPCGAISGLLAARQNRAVKRFYVCPQEVGEIKDPAARYYAIMRLAVPQDVSWSVTASPATQVKLAQTAAKHAEQLIDDVRTGQLRPPGDIPYPLRRQIESSLAPDPVTACRLANLAEKHGDLLPKHYWNLAFLANWTGGTMALHLDAFPYYFGDTPVRDIGLLATEGRVSIPLEDGTPAGVLDVTSSFFEFVDTSEGEGKDSKALRCHELTVGREYRVIMTTSAGLYRYDLGDHVRVHDFVGEAPVIEFLHRGAHVSSMTGEKLTEWQVTEAFRRVCRQASIQSVNFVLAPVWEDPPYYRLDVELEREVADRLALAMDLELGALNVEYASKRASDRLGCVRANPLPAGTLASLDAQRQSRQGSANEQFKHQYLRTTPETELATRDD